MPTDASLSTTARVRALGRSRPRLRFPRGRSDDALVARVRAGDERAFELVFDRYHRGLLAFCRRMLASDEEAEDALQHTFMAAYRALRSSDRPILLKAWLYTIARNRCLSILRARREQVALDDGARRQRRPRRRHRPPRRAARPAGRPRAAARGAARGARALRAGRPQPRRDRRGPGRAARQGEGARLPGARVARRLAPGARDAVRRGPRAARDGSAARRSSAPALRRHVVRCEGCAEFETEVRRQRAAMALLLPVVPTAGLKAAVLGAAGFGAGARCWGRRGLAGRAHRRREGHGGQDDGVRRGGRERRKRGLRRGARGADARRTRGRDRGRVACSHRPAASAARGSAGRRRPWSSAMSRPGRRHCRCGAEAIARGGRRAQAPRQGLPPPARVRRRAAPSGSARRPRAARGRSSARRARWRPAQRLRARRGDSARGDSTRGDSSRGDRFGERGPAHGDRSARSSTPPTAPTPRTAPAPRTTPAPAPATPPKSTASPPATPPTAAAPPTAPTPSAAARRHPGVGGEARPGTRASGQRGAPRVTPPRPAGDAAGSIGVAERHSETSLAGRALTFPARSRKTRLSPHARGADESLGGSRQAGASPRYRPSPPKIIRTVSSRMRRSRRQERCSMYQRSSSMRSSHGSSVRPLTCAQPVMPGLTARRPRWRSV